MLDLICRVFEALNEYEIGYCHWKSNVFLDEALKGDTDLDILVDRVDADRFRGIISDNGFKMAKDLDGDADQSVCHYYGMDLRTCILVHLHVYYRLVTGGVLLKNYKIPIEGMLLWNTDRKGIVRVPSKAAELVLLVVRKITEVKKNHTPLEMTMDSLKFAPINIPGLTLKALISIVP